MRLTAVDMRDGFSVLPGTGRSQAATMVLFPGRSTGGPDNRHPRSDQWLYVTSGSGTAVVDGEERELRGGAMLLIEAGEAHEVTNTGDAPLETINFFAPPVF